MASGGRPISTLRRFDAYAHEHAGQQAALAEHDAILFGAVGGVPGDARLKHANIDQYFLLGGQLDQIDWRTFEPEDLFERVNSFVQRRLNA